MIAQLKRIAQTRDGVFGVFLINYKPFCFTLEDCWLGNERNVSCVPSGVYLCEKFQSSIHGQTYVLKDVPGRSAILFHAGNYAGEVGEKSGDTDGCILLGDGLRLSEQGVANGIFPSKSAMKRFLSICNGIEHFTLEIPQFPLA